MRTKWNDKIFGTDSKGFESLSLDIFRFQYQNNAFYKSFVATLGIDPNSVGSIEQIPFLPIRFFKSHSIQTTEFNPAAIFESSGTTGSINSRHLIKDTLLYEESFSKTFKSFYGKIQDYCILGLLPSYFERKNSSLIYMVEKLIEGSKHSRSGFYMQNTEKLMDVLNELENQRQKTILIGVTFALLDLAEQFSLDNTRKDLTHIIIMETGGMKGRREEMIRPQVHAILKQAFHVSAIHSEYGMTELLSQAYSKSQGLFYCPPWMKVMVRDDEDPLFIQSSKVDDQPISGAINIIDLANIYSCSFIATDDLGRIYKDGSFEVMGRIDNSDLRGCSLMYV